MQGNCGFLKQCAGLGMCHPRPGRLAFRCCCVLAHSLLIALYAIIPGFPPSNNHPGQWPPVSSASMEMYHLPRCCMESYMVIASQEPQNAHDIPQQFQAIQHSSFFFKSVGGGEKKNHEVPEWMTHCRQNDKAVSERMGDGTLGRCCPGLSCALTHSSFIHSFLMSSFFLL